MVLHDFKIFLTQIILQIGYHGQIIPAFAAWTLIWYKDNICIGNSIVEIRWSDDSELHDGISHDGNKMCLYLIRTMEKTYLRSFGAPFTNMV